MTGTSLLAPHGIRAGAPSNVDELYVLYAGGVSPNCGTLSGWARALSAEMDTVFVGKSIVNEAMINLLNEMLYAARTGESTQSVCLCTAPAPTCCWVSSGGLIH